MVIISNFLRLDSSSVKVEIILGCCPYGCLKDDIKSYLVCSVSLQIVAHSLDTDD